MTFPGVDLSGVPDNLPQKRRLVLVAADLWRDEAVVALWLGGSLARGTGDAHSDVDLRVAVLPAAFEVNGGAPAGAASLLAAAVAGLHTPFGEDAILHHLLLDDGEIYDLFVQTTAREPSSEVRIVLACRDEAFGAKLAQNGVDLVTNFSPADPHALRRIIANFWISQQKHQKVLARGLPLLAWKGEHQLRQELIRLLFALATGNDCGPVGDLSIHTFSPVERAVRETLSGDDVLARIGRALTSEREIITATAELQDDVAHVGRRLAQRFGFVYPEAAEATVRQTWRRFSAERP